MAFTVKAQSAWNASQQWVIPAGGLPAGALLVVIVGNDVGASPLTSDSAGNSYTAITTATAKNGATFKFFVGAYYTTLGTSLGAGTTLTFTFSSNGGFASNLAYAVTSPTNLIIDASSITSVSHTTTGNISLPITASSDAELFFAAIGSAASGTSATASISSGWTTVNDGNSNFPCCSGYQAAGATTTSLTASFSTNNPAYEGAIGFTVYQHTNSTGTWASTGNTDTFSGTGHPEYPFGPWSSTGAADACSIHGGTVGGPWHSTELADTLAMIGHPEYPFGSWYSTGVADTCAVSGGILGGAWIVNENPDTFVASGHPEYPFGVWASDEVLDACTINGGVLGGAWQSMEYADTFAAVGYPENPIGTWVSREATDIWAAQGHFYVGGPWISIEAPDACGTIGGIVGLWGSFEDTDGSDFFDDAGIVAPPDQELPRGAGGAPPPIRAGRYEHELFRGREFDKSIRAVVPPRAVAVRNLTTPQHSWARKKPT